MGSLRRNAWALACGTLLAQLAMSAQNFPSTASKPMALTPVPIPPGLLRPTVDLDSARSYSLPELIDFAQSHNPETRVAWERAKQQLDQAGVARAALYPTLAVVALAQQDRHRVLFGNVYYQQDLTVVQPSLEVYYTVLDFGARRAGIVLARAGALVAEFEFNDTHRKLIYSIAAAYYRLNSARAQSEAAQATLTNAETVQAAVEERLRNGLATLPDVLEARAAAAQASYELENVRGLERLAHGQLAKSLGVRPTTTINVQPMTPAENLSLRKLRMRSSNGLLRDDRICWHKRQSYKPRTQRFAQRARSTFPKVTVVGIGERTVPERIAAAVAQRIRNRSCMAVQARR